MNTAAVYYGLEYTAHTMGVYITAWNEQDELQTEVQSTYRYSKCSCFCVVTKSAIYKGKNRPKMRKSS